MFSCFKNAQDLKFLMEIVTHWETYLLFQSIQTNKANCWEDRGVFL